MDRQQAIESYDTIQVISALLVGVGAALWPEVRYDMHHDGNDATLLNAANGGWGLQMTQILLIMVMTMNMAGLCTLSSQIFYMRQALAKDESGKLYDLFSKATKNMRWYAVQGILVSMPHMMFLIASVFYFQTRPSSLERVIAILTAAFSIFILYTMISTRNSFRALRKQQQKKKSKT